MKAKGWKIVRSTIAIPLGFISQILGLVGSADTGSQLASGSSFIPSLYRYLHNPHWWFPFLTAFLAVAWIFYVWRKEIAALVHFLDRELDSRPPATYTQVSRDGVSIGNSAVSAGEIVGSKTYIYHQAPASEPVKVDPGPIILEAVSKMTMDL